MIEDDQFRGGSNVTFHNVVSCFFRRKLNYKDVFPRIGLSVTQFCVFHQNVVCSVLALTSLQNGLVPEIFVYQRFWNVSALFFTVQRAWVSELLRYSSRTELLSLSVILSRVVLSVVTAWSFLWLCL